MINSDRGQPLDILIVEDDPASAALARAFLEEARNLAFDLRWVTTLADAAAEAARRTPAVVVLDLGLPDSTGIETFLSLRKQAPQAPIVVVSGGEDDGLAERLRGAGAAGYLPKRLLSPQTLVSAIRSAVKLTLAD